MGQQIQNISEELYDLCDKVKTQKEVDLLLKEIKDNGLDLCSVKGIFSHSMLGSFYIINFTKSYRKASSFRAEI